MVGAANHVSDAHFDVVNNRVAPCPMEPRVAETVLIAAVIAVNDVAAAAVVNRLPVKANEVAERAPVVVEVVVVPPVVPSLVKVVWAVALKTAVPLKLVVEPIWVISERMD